MFSLKAAFKNVSRFFCPTEEDRAKKEKARLEGRLKEERDKLDQYLGGAYYSYERLYYGSHDEQNPIFDRNLFLNASSSYQRFSRGRSGSLPGSILFIEGAADNIVVGDDNKAYLLIGSQDRYYNSGEFETCSFILRPLSPAGVEKLSPDVSERLKILASLDTMLSALNAKSSEATLIGKFFSRGLFSGAAGSIEGKFESLSGIKIAFLDWEDSFMSNHSNEIIVPVARRVKTAGPIEIAAMAKFELKRLEAAITPGSSLTKANPENNSPTV